MSEPATTTVVGNSVAALAAAERLAVAGRQVDLLCTGRPGAAFAGVELEGRFVEAGVRLIEREYVAGENAVRPPPLHHHVPGHGGHRPWMGLVENYLCELVPDLKVAPNPRLIVGDRCVEDFTLTGRVAAILQLFSASELAEIGRQAKAAWDRFGNEAGIFAFPDMYARASLAEASLANHGELFHRRVVEPLSRALVPTGAAGVAADQRHKIWAPLYWPSTLHEAATGSPVGFDPQRRFWTDGHGGMRSVVVNLMQRLRSAESVTVSSPGRLVAITNGERGVNLRFKNGLHSTVRDPIVGVSPGELFAAARIRYRPARVHMSLAWAEVTEAQVTGTAPTTLLQAELDAFRVSATGPRSEPGERVSRTFCVELRHQATAGVDLVTRALLAAGAVASPDDVTYLGSRDFDAFVMPNHQNRSAFEQAHSELRTRIPGAILIGGAAGYCADPLNEQLFAGIRAALEVSGAYV